MVKMTKAQARKRLLDCMVKLSKLYDSQHITVKSFIDVSQKLDRMRERIK